MKNLYLVVLTIVTVVSILFGTLRHVGGWGLSIGRGLVSLIQDGDWDAAKEASDTASIEKEEALPEFTSITADLRVVDLEIVSGDEFSIALDCEEDLTPEYDVTDGCLTLSQPDVVASRFANGSYDCDVTITVAGELSSVILNTNIGDIDFVGLKGKNLSLTASVGDIDLDSCTFFAASVTAELGDIDLESCSISDVEMRADLGDFDVTDLTFTTASVTASMGDVDLESCDIPDDCCMALSTSMGDVTVFGKSHGHSYTQDGSSAKLTVESSMGDITVSK